jgi:hypothetical protein
MRNIFIVLGLLLMPLQGICAAFSNGSFETPGLPASSVQTVNTGQSLGSWQVVNSPIDYGSTGVTYQGQTFSAFDGTAAVDLTGPGLNRNGAVEQTFDVLPSTTYSLTFEIGRFSSTLPLVTGVSTVGVLINGTNVGTFVNDLVSNSYSWQARTVQFATSPGQTSVTVRFFDANSGGPTTHIGLDYVGLTTVATVSSTSVPIPGFFIGIMAGLLVLITGIVRGNR